MSVQNSDLLLVQRGNVPYRADAEALSTKIRGDIDVSAPNKDIPVASGSQLGVIRVGNNLSIDANGILAAIVPAGLEYKGVWVDTNTPPSASNSGEFWIWDGGDNQTLNNALWGTANGDAVNDGDRIFYDGTTFEVVHGGGGGIETVSGTAPIVVSGAADSPDVSITPASASADGSMSKEHWDKLESIEAGAQINVDTIQSFQATSDQGILTLSPSGDITTLTVATDLAAGLMSAADKATLDGLVTNPGGVSSVTARNGITNNGTPSAPILDVNFGALPNGDVGTAQVMPYDISALGELQ
jgi:hypothetical protein